MERDHYGARIALAVALLCALSAGASAAITTNPASPVNVGDVTVGQSASVTVTVTSSTNARGDFAISSCTGGNGTFSLDMTTNVNLNNPVAIQVSYMAAGSGTRTCTVIITETGTTTELGRFTITATGKSPPKIVLGANSLSFTAVRFFNNAAAPTATSSTQNLTISNDGDAPLTVTLSFTGANADNRDSFSIDSTSAEGATATIGGKSAKSWKFKFDPLTAGDKTATINIASNDPMTATATVTVSGTGTTGEFSIAAPNNGSFGTVASGSSDTIDINVTHTGTGTKGPLTITNATVASTNGLDWFAIAASPGTLSATMTTGAVTVRCSPPAGSTATAMGTVSVTADSDASTGPSFRTTRTASITCTGGASNLAIDLNDLQFGAHEYMTTSPAQTVNLSNATGTSAATVTFASTSTNASQFTVTGPNGCGGAQSCTIPIGGSIALSVTFTPTLEGTLSASFRVNGAGTAPSFTVTGRGTDRHIAWPTAVQFPDTFRNPGTKATVAPVTIMNTGEARLDVSEIMFNGDPAVWSIVEPTGPFSVDGNGTYDILVRFAPVEAGKAEDAQLVLVNNDRVNSAPLVVLAGNGKNRNVDMTPGAIDVGDTFAGVPTRLSVTRPEEMLVVVNMEEPDPVGALTDFQIREIAIEGDGASAFEVVGIDGNSLTGRTLPAGESVQVDVVFKPEYVGDFEATLVLYLDEDEQPQKPVPVRGRALFVDAHGSGGCSITGTSGDGSRGALLLVLAVLALVLRRRS